MDTPGQSETKKGTAGKTPSGRGSITVKFHEERKKFSINKKRQEKNRGGGRLRKNRLEGPISRRQVQLPSSEKAG